MGEPIRFECDCGQKISISDAYVDTEFACPQCGIMLRVPGPESPATRPVSADERESRRRFEEFAGEFGRQNQASSALPKTAIIAFGAIFGSCILCSGLAAFFGENPAASPRPAAELTEEERAAAAIRNIRSVQQVIIDEGTISVSFNTSGRVQAQVEAKKVLQAAAHCGYDFSHVHLFGVASMADKFGNTAETAVVQLAFERATVNRINWPKFLHEHIYDVADHAVIHPEFRR